MFSLFSTAASHAEKQGEHNSVMLTLKGNTVEGIIIKTGAGYKMYLHPSGMLVRIVGDGNAEKGKWRINDDNELCVNLGSEVCRKLIHPGENRYYLFSLKGELEVTIQKNYARHT